MSLATAAAAPQLVHETGEEGEHWSVQVREKVPVGSSARRGWTVEERAIGLVWQGGCDNLAGQGGGRENGVREKH